MILNTSSLYNKEITPIESYASIVAELKKEIIDGQNSIVEISFEKDNKIEFIHPLFLVHILNLYEFLQVDEKYNSTDIRIKFDIENLNYNIQTYIQIYLIQYIDCGIVEVIDQKYNERSKSPFTFTHKKILLYCTPQENVLTLILKQNYKFLPITKIANNDFNENFFDKDYWLTENEIKKQRSNDNRKYFYKSLKLETIENGVYKNKSHEVWKDIFETYLILSASDSYLTTKFQEIFREIVENIQKHTKIDNVAANGYISFFKDTHYKNHNQYELIVSDDYQYGFLSKYYETLKKEIKDENKNSIAWNGYNQILKDFENQNFEHILKSIFNLEYILSAQAKRVNKHFGMPILLKIVRELELLSQNIFKNDYVQLHIYLNFYEKSFLVIYKNALATVIPLENDSVRGTYLHLSFPDKLELLHPGTLKQEPLLLKTKKYNHIFLNQVEIRAQLSKFQFFRIEDIRNKLPANKEKKSLLIDYTENKYSISDFLRYIYSYAYIYSMKDILVVNFPIEKELDYLLILADAKYFHSFVNIAFLNNSQPKVLYLGGETKGELRSINCILSNTYNYNKRNFIDPSNTYKTSNKVDVNSNLFYTSYNQNLNFIPFEIFQPYTRTSIIGGKTKSHKEYIYTKMLDAFLEKKENYEKIHLDLKNGYHINKFFYLKNIFENSQWINIIAFDLAQRIHDNIKKIEDASTNQKVILVGIEKYSSMILAVVQNILGSSLETYIIQDLNNLKNINQFNTFVKSNNTNKFIFFRPVVFECRDIKDLLNDIVDYKLYSAIKLTTKNINSYEWETLYLKNIDTIILNTKKDNCPFCFPKFEKDKEAFLDKPIYKIDDDKYNIKNLYKDNFTANESNITPEVSWKNSIYFGHTIRNTNHYLYYIRTINFLKNNVPQIEKSFIQHKSTHNTSKVPIILSANHNTNSEFISLINKIIFDGNAIVHTFSLDYKEQVLYSLEHFKNTHNYTMKYHEFYFVDDEVASGDTLEYFFNILKLITNTNDIEFKAVYTLIDRTSVKDKSNILNQYSGNFYSFVNLNIHPIKTGFEKCYLCKREEYLQDIADNSSLVFIKNAFYKKISSSNTSKAVLRKRHSKDIEFEPISQVEDFKNYLKMYATEYIYENLEKFSTIEFEYNKFYQRVQEYFRLNYLHKNQIASSLDTLLRIEAKIAFIKSLSFPKILFFEKIREKVHNFVYNELYEFIIDNHGNVKTINKDLIEPKLSFDEYKKLSEENEILEIISYCQDKDRTDLDYFNFLLSTASYLGINIIMSKQMVEFYFNLTQTIKDDNNGNNLYKRYKRLLGIYPVAIKQITYFSNEKSKYFYEQLELFYDKNKFQYTRQFSRIFGLYVENTKFLENTKILDYSQDQQLLLKDVKEEIINNLEIFIKKEDNFGSKYDTSNIKIESFFVNINQDIKSPKLIDILNNYKEAIPNSYEESLYIGAHTKDSVGFENTIDIHHNPKKNPYNIWCNFLKNDKTYVRLTDSNLNPFCVIIVRHNEIEDLQESAVLLLHLKISRRILAKQNEIINIFKTNEFISSIRDSVNILAENKSKMIKSSHGAAGDINNALTYLQNEQELFINLWKAYCNTYIGNMYLDENKEKHNIAMSNDSNELDIQHLIKYIHYLNNTRSVKISLAPDMRSIAKFQISNNYINIFLSLFIDNAIKHSDINSEIKIFIEDEKLVIENNPTLKDVIDHKQLNKNLIIEPFKISENQGITLYTINKYLNNVNCSLETHFENSKFKIYIIKR